MTILTTRRRLLMGIGLTALAACAPAACAPRGGTRMTAGKGARADRPSEGGVGGTGIVGIVHDTGSLLVNGLRVEIHEGVVASDAFGTIPPSQLGIGQSVTIEAAEDAAGVLVARSVAAVHPLIGPIDSITAEGFRCLGAAVTLEPGALLRGPAGAFVPQPGQRVAVSGLWRGQEVVAARVDLMDPAEDVVVAGEVAAGRSAGGLRLGGLVLVLPRGTVRPPAGSFVTVTGRRVGNALMVQRLVKDRFRGLAGPIARLSVEGYLETAAAAPGYAVSGLGHSFDEAAKLADLAAGRALFVGPYDGDFRVSLGLPLPEAVPARRSLLAQVDDGFAPPAAHSTR